MKNQIDKQWFTEYLDQRFKNIDLQFCAVREEIENLRGEIEAIKLTSTIVGAIGGLLTAIGGFLGIRWFNK